MRAEAFRIFDVSARSWSGARDFDKHCKRLAVACQTDPELLACQFRQFEEAVRREISTTGCDNKEAWRRVLQKLSKCRSRTKAAYPSDSLRPAIERWFAFCASTSGVEQGFTKGQLAFGCRQEAALPLHESSVLKLKVDASRPEFDAVCELAKKVWTRCFGIPRQSGSQRATRIDAGMTRKRKLDARPANSEASFLRARRAVLGSPSASSATTKREIDELQVLGP